MIPIADHNPTRVFPLVNWLLIVACVVVFIQQISSAFPFDQIVGEYGFIPARVLGGVTDEDYDWPTAPWVTALTSMFLHGSWLHLGGNMLYLYVFGDNIENAMGKVRYLLFYLLGGVAAALAQGLMDTSSIVPMVGASGAISAVLGAYVVLYPRQPVTVIVPNMGVQQFPALGVLGLWFVTQFLYGVLGSEGGVAFFAHVGGFVAGLVMVKVFTFSLPVTRNP